MEPDAKPVGSLPRLIGVLRDAARAARLVLIGQRAAGVEALAREVALAEATAAATKQARLTLGSEEMWAQHAREQASPSRPQYLLGNLMRSSERTADMWDARRDALVESMSGVLAHIRFASSAQLTFDLARSLFELDKLESFVWSISEAYPGLPSSKALSGLQDYLKNLGGYDLERLGNQDSRTHEQHMFTVVGLTWKSSSGSATDLGLLNPAIRSSFTAPAESPQAGAAAHAMMLNRAISSALVPGVDFETGDEMARERESASLACFVHLGVGTPLSHSAIRFFLATGVRADALTANLLTDYVRAGLVDMNRPLTHDCGMLAYRSGCTPLEAAVVLGDAARVHLFVAAGADPLQPVSVAYATSGVVDIFDFITARQPGDIGHAMSGAIRAHMMGVHIQAAVGASSANPGSVGAEHAPIATPRRRRMDV
jgi:hypothetical protein